MKRLPKTGTAALLELLSAYVPDDLVNELLRERRRRGRPASFSPAQLFRVLLLSLLTPAHSFNLLTELLPEHRTWRSFGRLRNLRQIPDVRMLHDFRSRLQLTHLRRINEYLLEPLLETTGRFAKSVAVIDSTDLPAATNGYKKTLPVSTALTGPKRVDVAARKDRAVISSATKNTRCESGFVNASQGFCWCP